MPISPSPSAFFAWLLVGLAVLGCVYQLLAAFAVHRWAARRRPIAAERRAVTLLKPLCGEEIRLDDNLRSFTRLAYPQTQMVCGVRERNDAAIAAVKRLQAGAPDSDVALVIDPR